MMKVQADTMNTQRDAIEYVNESLKTKNYAIVHKDDLLGEAEKQLWDDAAEFVDKFASSREASEFEQAFFEQMHQVKALDEEERDVLTPLVEAENKANEELTSAQAAMDRTLKLTINPYYWFVRRKLKAAWPVRKAASKKRAIVEKEFHRRRYELSKTFKPYVFNHKHWLGRSLRFDDPSILLSTASPFLDVAEAYYGERAKLRIPTVWRVSPLPSDMREARRMGSQRWHRDQTDTQILKLFIYYTDVDEGTGALEYIPDSLPQNSKWSKDIPLTESTGYPPQNLISELVPDDEIVTCRGRAGSLAFVDTAGLHRGGYATTGHRVTCQATYLRQNPKHPQTALLRPGVTADFLTDQQRFALS